MPRRKALICRVFRLDFHQQGCRRPEQERADHAAGIDFPQQRAIEGELPAIGQRHLGRRLRRRAIGLVVDDQHLVGRDGQAIDLAADREAAAPGLHRADQRHFRPRAFGEQRGMAGGLGDGQRFGQPAVDLLRREAMRGLGEEAPGGGRPLGRRERRQGGAAARAAAGRASSAGDRPAASGLKARGPATASSGSGCEGASGAGGSGSTGCRPRPPRPAGARPLRAAARPARAPRSCRCW